MCNIYFNDLKCFKFGNISDNEALSRLQKLKFISNNGFLPFKTYLQKSSTDVTVNPLLFERFK